MKKIFKFLTGRLFIVSAMILVQLAIVLVTILFLSQYTLYMNTVLIIISILITLYIVIKRDNPMYKLAWIIPILLFPVVGGVLYFIFGRRNIPSKSKKRLMTIYHKMASYSKQEETVLHQLEQENPFALKQSRYISDSALAPVYQNTDTRFLTPGETKFEAMVEELKKAKHFIFLEYFIIHEGKMWNTILEVLRQKAAEGVDVRLLYDDIGTINLLPSTYPKKLKELGIKTAVFNPMRPSLDVFMSYRDHRKIAVIDGNVGFTGGINLADEYINEYEKYGYWKDSSVELRGEAVWNLTVMFLSMWEYATESTDEDYEQYKPTLKLLSKGYVQPFSDSPLDDKPIGEFAYMNMINNAKRYIYISTPYLILDNEMASALILAAESGIDVRITTPHVADKWYVHTVTRANYTQLIEAGVKIYEYTPGFIHAKTMVVDDEFAIVGTTNFDFRSFYLHFECGVWMYRTDAVMQVYEDYQAIMEQSQVISLESCTDISFPKRILRAVLQLFAPLM